MLTLDPPEAIAAHARNVVFCAGFFDGVHLGHQALIAAAVKEAARCDFTAPAALTFRRHPQAVLARNESFPLVVPDFSRKLEFLEAAGLKFCLALDFSVKMAAMPPDEFVKWAFGPWFAGDTSRRCLVVCGPNWRFGAGGAGRPQDIPALSDGRVEAKVVPLAEVGGAPVSSSRIRDAVSRGDLETATALLGRPWESDVDVFEANRGRGVGSAILGAPTANATVPGFLRPPVGVYAVDAVIISGDQGCKPATKWSRAVANYGFRPTFPDARPDAPVLEIHFLDKVDVDLHGRHLRVRWLTRIRDERKFDTPAALAAQIRADIAAAGSTVRPALPGTCLS